jgi:hypothetical protein
MPVPGNNLKMAQGAGLQAMPEVEAGFYNDLIIKAVKAVYTMKQSQTWPGLLLSKCAETMFKSAPTTRTLDLLSTFKVDSSLSLLQVFYIYFLYFRLPVYPQHMVHSKLTKMG